MTANANSPAKAQVAALPADAIVVHIGPYKTGTSALQATFGKHRGDLAEHDVLYRGRRHDAVWALRGRGIPGKPAAPRARWERFAAELSDHHGRSLISSEYLSGLGSAKIAELIEDLGAERVHVVMTIRPIAPLLPSDWQEKVKSHGFTQPYDEWLTEVLDPLRQSEAAHRFWRLYGAAELLDRWSTPVTADRTVVIASDGSDRSLARRTFEGLLGLPDGLLTETDTTTHNVSLSADRIELLRKVNEAFVEHAWPDSDLRELIHRGLLRGLSLPVPSEPGRRLPGPPAWAYDQLRALSAERAEIVRAAGTTLVGDPSQLLFIPPSTAQPPSEPTLDTVGVETAANGIEAILTQAKAREQELHAQLDQARSRRVGAVPGRELVTELGRRFGRRARRARPR